jgi:HEAT repeat protein
MFRKQLASAVLIRALSIGTTAPLILMGAGVLCSCQDESQPEYWVEKLSDNAWRARAIKTLDQFFEDSVTRANGDEEAPEVKALIDKIVEPLTSTYVAESDNLDEKARARLIKLITTMRDPRTEPALTKALDNFAQRGRGGDDAKWAARAVADMKVEGAADEMLQAFTKLRANSPEGGPIYRDYNKAMVKMAHASWTPTLTQLLEPAIEPVNKGEKNPQRIAEFHNQQFWQTTSAEVLGAIGDSAAVEPLLKVVLDPSRGSVGVTALIALVKIGKPAAERTLKLLADPEDPLAGYAALRVKKFQDTALPPTDRPHVRKAAMVLGMLSHPSAEAGLIAALEREDLAANRAVILQELVKLPASKEITSAFESGFDGVASDVTIPTDSPDYPGPRALPALADAASSLMDTEAVPWVLSQAAKYKKDTEVASLLLETAIKLMQPDQVSAVAAAVKNYGTPVHKSVLDEATALVGSCKSDAACYVAAATKSENQEKEKQFIGIKAAYMVGLVGDDKARDALIAKFDEISNGAVRFAAVKSVDHLTPKGSTQIADTLQEMVDENVRRGDPNKIMGDAPVKHAIYRLRSRAES